MGRLGIGDRLNNNSKQGVIFTEEYRDVYKRQLQTQHVSSTQLQVHTRKNVSNRARNTSQ